MLSLLNHPSRIDLSSPEGVYAGQSTVVVKLGLFVTGVSNGFPLVSQPTARKWAIAKTLFVVAPPVAVVATIDESSVPTARFQAIPKRPRTVPPEFFRSSCVKTSANPEGQ